MSYHSYRNIGFVFTDTEANCVKWRAKFVDYDPRRAIEIMGFRREDNYLFIDYFNRPYRLRLGDGALEKLTDQRWTEELFMNEALVLYHVLGDLAEKPSAAGEWVPEAELDPVRIRSGNRTDPMLTGFARDFTGKLERLARACEGAGGRKLEQGDCSYEFEPFPQTPVRLVFWEADEDFPAQVQALVDRNITDYMHFEAVGCMIADLFELIDRADKENMKL